MHYDICIIGTGIGSGSLLSSLDLNKINLAIVEAGSIKPSYDSVTNDQIGRDFGIRSTTAIQAGGTSNLWHGVLSPLDESDFMMNENVSYSGWPISYKDLKPYYRKASSILKLNNYDLFDIENFDNNLKNKIDDVSFNQKILKNKIFQQPVPPRCFKDYIYSINDRHSNIDLYENNVALELKHRDGHVSELKIGRNDGSISYIKADIFIIGSGALETPRLLLNSMINNYNVGRFLMDHPMGNLCQLEFLKPIKAPLYSDMKISTTQRIKSGLVLKHNIRKRKKLLNHSFYLRPSFTKGICNESEKIKLSLLAFKDGRVSLSDFWKVITNLNVVRQIIAYKLSLNVTFKYADLFFICEQSPNPDSQVTLSSKCDRWGYPIAQVDWKVLSSDIDNTHEWFDFLLNDFFPKDKCKFVSTSNDFNWESIYTSAAHHVGTARMSHSKENGVVDKNLKVFDFDNLYICDGSIFPTSGNVNSSFTISALACRLADHLKKI